MIMCGLEAAAFDSGVNLSAPVAPPMLAVLRLLYINHSALWSWPLLLLCKAKFIATNLLKRRSLVIE
jgi:hypothetical protein